jgi:hypothetical protein
MVQFNVELRQVRRLRARENRSRVLWFVFQIAVFAVILSAAVPGAAVRAQRAASGAEGSRARSYVPQHQVFQAAAVASRVAGKRVRFGWLQMARVAAEPAPALAPQLRTFRQRTMREFVSDLMSKGRMALMLEGAVSVARFRSDPGPATARPAAAVHQAPKFFRCVRCQP